MRSGNFGYWLAGILLGLVAGFTLANSFYRAQLQAVNLNVEQAVPNLVQPKGEVGTANSNPDQLNLSDEELHQAIARADNNPEDLQLQRKLGLSLYRYAVLEQQSGILPDVIRILKRAEQDSLQKDSELFVTLGDALLVLGREGESQKIIEARSFYQKALQVEPKNADFFVGLGLTYLLAEPSNPSQALIQFQQALQLNSRHERALGNVVAAYLALKKDKEAADNLERLRQLNPQSTVLKDLQIQISQRQISEK
jgi:tetratricopeptide (TPR) repeat protein